MNHRYCECKEAELEMGDSHNNEQFCIKCGREVEPFEPDVDAQIEQQAIDEAEARGLLQTI